MTATTQNSAGVRYQDWHDLFRELSAYEGVGAEDVIAAIAPLMRQTLELHEQGLVAPLDGIEALGVHRGRLFLGPHAGLQPKDARDVVNRLQGMAGELDLEGGRRAWDAPEPVAPTAAFQGSPDAVRARLDGPTHAPGYRCWEHALGHHDALTDIFCLGQLAGSLATGLDFTEPDQLTRFAASRRSLTRLNPRLHPAVARAITKMTELDRRDREQDLSAALDRLESYRRLARASRSAQAPDAPKAEAALTDPAEAAQADRAFPTADPRTKMILSELRGRLYDLSKRNKLIFHRPSTSELDLTEASTPIVVRADAIRPDQIFTLASTPARALLEGDAVALGEVIRFDEMAHAAPTLDKLRAEDRRDRAEYGFSQLRLIIGFLDWRNLKEDPETPIRSPLLLLPVKLKKRRGVRDSFELTADGAEAEVNPTLRRYLQLLYGVELPRSVDLGDARAGADAVRRLHEDLVAAIARTEPSVALDLVETPDLFALHRRAAKRVDLFKRRARAGATGRRRYGDLDYSYQKQGYRPLGVQLYEKFVSPPPPPGGAPEPAAGADVAHAAGPAPAPTPDIGGFAMSAAPASEDNPFAWSIDLSALTLANLNYRRMSLVRDFDALLSGASERLREAGAAAFDEIFADRPKPISPAPALAPLAERRSVTTTDPTQDAAVQRARSGESFVIQGPPGAGKSQTIANLIADQTALGRRILFVCEKRAALDVVLRRLEALGLAPLCAHVHDAQEDKKVFVQELRDLFETWTAPSDPVAPEETSSARRERALTTIEGALARLEALDRDMRATLEGEPTHALLTRAAAASDQPPLDDAARARAPSLKEWREGESAARAMADALRRAGAEPVLARHPARFVSAEACADPALFERLTGSLDALGPHMDLMSEAAQLAELQPAGEDSQTAGRQAPLGALFAQIDYAARLEPIARAGRLRVFNVDSQLAAAVKRRVDDLALERAEHKRAQERTTLWGEKLSAMEVEAALALARKHEGSFFGFLSKPWRDARDEVTRRCKLDELAVKPRIQDLLEDLAQEHAAAAQVDRRLREIAEEVGLSDGAAALALVEERDARMPAEGPAAAPLLEAVAADPAAAEPRITQLAALKNAADEARAAIASCFEGLEDLPVDSAFSVLAELRAQRDALPAFAPALRELAGAPESVRLALRRIDGDVEQIDRAIVTIAVERALSLRPALREASGAAIDAARGEISAALKAYQAANAALTFEAARERFLAHIGLTQRLELELSDEERGLRREYVDARRELERELAKSQRFRAIRELLAGPAGLLIRDLKPIWMMSPLSVADVLPLEAGQFDLVIFDEASQVTAEAAAPSLFRAGQAVVVGDEKQMPPSQFFTAAKPGADEEAELASEDETADGPDPVALMRDLDADSLLSQAGRTLPSTLLGWHYRSRSEELIAFSNAVFYGGKLITIPSVRRRREAPAIEVKEPEDGVVRWRDAVDRAVSFHHTPFGRFDNRKNPGEAAYVAELLRGLLMNKTDKSLGVVAFSEAHASEIERQVEKLAKSDAKFRRAYEAELEREVGGEFAGLFIKNLENVQGDERDLMIVSVGYAPDLTGRLRLNFGPVNREGGERRLNVLFTRAKEHVALVSSITAEDIGAVCNDGALCLRSYIAYAAAASRGDDVGSRRVLSVAGRDAAGGGRRASPLAQPLAAALQERGFLTEISLGASRFTVDLAVRKEGDPDWRLAVLIDGPAHYEVADPLERYALRPSALEAFGWKAITVLSADWRRDQEAVIARIAAELS